MTDLIKEYCEYAISIMDESGIYPTPAIAKTEDEKLTVYAMATEPDQIVSMMLDNGAKCSIVEQVFALDTYTKAGQGTALDSCLVLFHVIRGQTARLGILEYSWNAGEPITKPVDWHNPFWTNQYTRLVSKLTSVFQ